MTNSSHSDSRISGSIRKCGLDDAKLLHRLSVETYVDTFDGTSSDEDMQKYLEETYAEPILREELANPDSMFFVISMPSGAQTEAQRQGHRSGNAGADSADSACFVNPGDFADTAGADTGNLSNSTDSVNPTDSANSASPTSPVNALDSTETSAGYMKLNFGDAQVEDMGLDAMEVQRLYIRKAFKGCGLGTQLMNLALKTARERGLKKVWLGVWEHNEPAKRFYTGKGFVRVGQHAFWQGDDKQTDYLMAREV